MNVGPAGNVGLKPGLRDLRLTADPLARPTPFGVKAQGAARARFIANQEPRR